MKKTILNITLFMIMLATSAFQTVSTTSQETVWKLLVSIPVGKQPGEIAYLSQDGYGRMQGPESFTVSPDGTVYILDSVNARILYKAKGVVKSIKLPGTLYPTDIRWQNDNAVILDDSNRIVRYSTDGKMLRKTDLPTGVKSEQVYTLMEDDGKIGLWAQNSHAFDVDALPSVADLSESSQPQGGKGLGPGIPAPDGTRWQAMYDGLTQGLFVTPDGKHKIVVEAYGMFGSARLVGFDKQSNLYILVEDLYDATPDQLGVEMSIRKYAPDGSLLGAAVFPAGEAVVPSKHPVQVTANGQVYAMIARKQAVAVYAVTLGKTYQTKAYRVPLDINLSKDQSTPNETSQVGVTTLSSKSRLDIYTYALTMTTTKWIWRNSYDFFNRDTVIGGTKDIPRNTNKETGQTKPNQLEGLVAGSTVTGIPYYFGGFDSPYTTQSSKWANWTEALAYYRTKIPPEAGPLVGNVNPNIEIHQGGVGLDCSGFVAAASRLYTNQAKPGTDVLSGAGAAWRDLSIPSDTPSVAFRRLQPMNFLVKTGIGKDIGHTLYYIRKNTDLGGISTLEATTAGNPQGAKAYVRLWDEIKDFPYYRSWWDKANGDVPEKPLTAMGVGSACYKLAGQAVWYKFTVPAGARNVTLTNILAGSDPDLYVYSSTFGMLGSSYQGGTTNESVSINGAGTYYAMVHIWKATGTGCVTWTISW